MIRKNEDSSSKQEQAYSLIRNEILTHALRAGSRVNISDTASRAKLSLGAVREALSRLTTEGLVISEKNKGFKVAPVTLNELVDLTNTRIWVETECIKNSIKNGDLDWESQIVSSIFRLLRTEIYANKDKQIINSEWNNAHADFHCALILGCNSHWMLRLRDILYVQSERYRSATAGITKRTRDLNEEHKKLSDAVLARDVKLAVDLMTNHLQLTKDLLISEHFKQG